MSFLDTLKSLGLWQQPQQGQPQQNPYGLDPEMVKQARMQALGNIGGQILAMSQQMTPDQRARMMAGADWTGGLQTNLYNAAQMKLMGDAAQRRQTETQRAEEARASIAEMIKKTPPGRVRDAAYYFFQAGDYGKAGELLFKQERRFNPYTAGYEVVDAFGSPINASATASPQPGAGVPQQTAVAVPPASGGAPAPGPSPIPTPTSTELVPGAGGEVDATTQRWRALTRDPSLTPAEVQQMVMAAAAKGDPNAAMEVYRDLKKQRIEQSNTDETQTQTALNNTRNAAEKLRSDFDTSIKGYQTIITAAERGEQIASDPKMSPADKLAVLYEYIKTLDPLGAVRDSDVELAQSIQPAIGRLEQLYKSWTEGGTISNAAIQDIARTMGRLGTDARGRMGRKEIEVRRIAEARQVSPDMVFGKPQRGRQGPPAPIGSRIPPAPLGENDQPLTLEMQPQEKGFFKTYFGGR